VSEVIPEDDDRGGDGAINPDAGTGDGDGEGEGGTGSDDGGPGSHNM
jgi:hypothetical protein